MILDRALAAAKAIVAAVTPIVTALILDVAADLGELGSITVAAVATALTVYLTPNKEAPVRLE